MAVRYHHERLNFISEIMYIFPSSPASKKKFANDQPKQLQKSRIYIFLFTNKMRDKFVIENQVHQNIVRLLVEVTARALKDTD